jgi:hypothetical protein
MPDVTPWDIWVVSATTLAKVAYVSNWNSCQFGDQVSDPGHGAVNFDYDEAWLTTFYNDNSEFPWEGNYAVQIYRDGSLVFAFLIEEAEIEYAGPRRRAIMGGRGLAACLEWAIVIPEKYDEGLVIDGNPDGDALVEVMGRAFGSTHNVQTDLETQGADTMPRHGTMGIPESYHGPKYKAYGGGAFVHLFKEASLGVPATAARWLDTDSTPGGTRGVEAWTNVDVTTLPGGGGYGDRNGDPVDWPLSLSSNLTEQYDSNGQSGANEWSYTSTYTADDVQWLFELPTGQNYLQVLGECAAKTANSQWRVAPNGEISIAKTLGADLSTGSSAVVLTVPQARRAANSLRRTDLRTSMFISNDYIFERAVDATAETTYGRREGYVKYDNTHGQSNIDAANQALNEVKDVLDEFTFQYIETDTTRAWADFDISDTVKIEYEPGVFSSRQVVGLSANVTPTSFAVEVTIGEAVDNIIARLRKVEETEQYSPQITQANASSSSKPIAPLNIVAVAGQEGGDRFATITFDQPKGWENEILLYEAVVNPVDAPTKTYRRTTSVNRRSTQQEVVIHGLPSGPEGKEYEVSARSVTKTHLTSGYHVGDDFTVAASSLDDVTGESDAPDGVSNISLFPMLNAILVKFSDLNGGNDHAMVGNRGRYEIQISNNSGSFSESSGNEWTQTFGTNTSGQTGDDAQTYVVPSGDGFICAGLKSESPARRHFVRVRSVNWDNTPQTASGGWSTGSGEYSEWVDLDLADQSQLGVIIGKEGIWASHIKAGTIDTTRIDTGTLTASNADIGQIFTSAIRMPQPATADDAGELNDGTVGNEMTFNINHDGDVWWGNYSTIANAKSGTVVSGTDGSTSWIDKTGNAQFIGTISTGAGSATDILASGNAGEPRLVLGDNAGSVVDTGDSTGGYGYILGFTGVATEAIPGHAVWTDESGIAAGYFVAPRFHSGFNYSGVRLRDNHTTHAEALLVSSAGGWAGLVKGTDVGSTAHAEPSFVVNAAGGIYLYDDNAPSPYTNRLYSVSGDLYWNGVEVGAGGSGDLTAVTAGITSGMSVTSGTGPIPDISLNLGKLSVVLTPALGDKVGLYDTSLATTGYCTVQDIVDLAGTGDVTDVVATASGGLYSGQSSGPIPTLSLSLLTNLDSTTPVVGDWVAIHDNSLGSVKRVTIQNINDLGPQGDVIGVGQTTSRGIVVTDQAGPTPYVGLDIYNNLSTTTIDGADWIAVWDTNLSAHRRVQASTIADLNTYTGGNGIAIDNANVITHADTSALVGLQSYSNRFVETLTVDAEGHLTAVTFGVAGGASDHGGLTGLGDNDHPQYSLTGHTHSYLPLTGGTLSGGITFSNGNHITGSSSSNVYFQGGSNGTSWLRANAGSSAKIKCGSGGDIVLYASPRPNGNVYHDLGTASLYWNYSYFKKLPTPPDAAGTGWYLWTNTSNELMKAGSSVRLKKDITTISTSDALTRIKALRPVEFTPKKNHSELTIDNMWEYERFRGFIAEEVAEVDHGYGVYNWWRSDDPESEDYDKKLLAISEVQNEWTDEEVAAYYDIDKATAHMFDLHAILADSVAAIQALEARIAVLES